MNKYLKRIAASVLTMAVGLSLFTACGCSASRGSNKIAGDDPWYDVNTVVIDDDVDESDYQYRFKLFEGIVGDKAVFDITSSYMPEGQSEPLSTTELVSYDLDGNLVARTEIMSALKALDLGTYVNINSIDKYGNGIRVISYVNDAEYNYVGTYQTFWNVETGELSETTQFVNSEYSDILGNDAALRSFTIGDLTIEYYYVWQDQPDSLLLVRDASGNETLIDLREQLPGVSVELVYDIPVVMENGDNKALVCLGMANGIMYLDLDLNTFTVSVCQEDYSWLDNNVRDIKNVDGLGTVVIDGNGISSIDLDNKTLNPIFSYSSCNVNRYVVDDLYPVSATEDKVVMTGVVYNDGPAGFGDNEQMVLMIFNRADSNPNAGKTVIKIASISGYSYALCDAVCRFNEQNSEYFAEFDTRYELENYADSNTIGYDYDSLSSLCKDVNSDLGNQLSVDLLAGEGPDIIIGGSSYSQLNNPDYLVDLTDYINSNFTDANYFMNVVDAAKTGDALYQLPISFCIAGITAPAADVEAGQIGFTFEQYNDFVSGPCNGNDPMKCGQNDFFITVMNSMKDLMIGEDRRFNFDNEAFRALADYTSQYVNNPMELPDGETYIPEDWEPSEMVIGGLYSYHRRVLNYNKVFMGYPSYDGRGPLIVGHSSIAVSASASCKEGCMEFVSTVMSPECQRNFGCEYGFPLSRNAFDTLSVEYIEAFNKDLELSLRTSTAEELRSYGRVVTEADDSIVASLRGVIESLDGDLYVVDAPVDAIILEEIPGYFEGQKSLDDVIRIVNDRTGSVAAERF